MTRVTPALVTILVAASSVVTGCYRERGDDRDIYVARPIIHEEHVRREEIVVRHDDDDHHDHHHHDRH